MVFHTNCFYIDGASRIIISFAGVPKAVSDTLQYNNINDTDSAKSKLANILNKGCMMSLALESSDELFKKKNQFVWPMVKL